MKKSTPENNSQADATLQVGDYIIYNGIIGEAQKILEIDSNGNIRPDNGVNYFLKKEKVTKVQKPD